MEETSFFGVNNLANQLLNPHIKTLFKGSVFFSFKTFHLYHTNYFLIFVTTLKKLTEEILLIMAVTSAMATFGQNKTKITYPTTKGATVDAYFDAKLPDPYRWLEDDKSAETGAWVKAKTSNYGYLKFRFMMR
jgi:hypothetical protein